MNNLDQKQQTYKEIQQLAASYHPDAYVELDSNQWKIIIPTGVTEKVDSSDWAGTPAEEAYNTYEPNYGSDLDRWAVKNGLYDSPMELVAAVYNITCEESSRFMEQLKIGLDAEPLLPSMEEILDKNVPLSREQQIVYSKIYDEVTTENKEYIQNKKAELNKQFFQR